MSREWIDVYQKYADKLADLLEKGLSREDLDLISKEFLEVMEKVCRGCQANRMHCILMPRCGQNRPFLSMLIEMGVDKGNLPQFCYSQLLKEVQMAFKGTKTLRDASIPLEDFLKTVFRSYRKIFDLIMSRNLKKLTKVLSKETAVKNKKVSILDKEDRIYFVIDGLTFYVDMDRNIVHFNPYNTPLISLEELKAFIELFSLEAGIDVEIEKEIGGILTLNVHFPVKTNGENIKSPSDLIDTIIEKYGDKIPPFFNHIDLYVSQDKVNIIFDLEMKSFENFKHITPGNVLEFFNVLKEFRNDLLKRSDKNEK